MINRASFVVTLQTILVIFSHLRDTTTILYTFERATLYCLTLDGTFRLRTELKCMQCCVFYMFQRHTFGVIYYSDCMHRALVTWFQVHGICK